MSYRRPRESTYHPSFQVRNQGGAFGTFASPETFKTLRSNFDICRNFQRMTMKFYILIIFKKYYWNFSLSCPLIISLKDLSWDRLSDQKFRKWLVFNHKYAGIVNVEIVKCLYFQGIFYPFVRVLFCLKQASIFPHWNFITLGYCWTVQIAETFKLIKEILT